MIENGNFGTMLRLFPKKTRENSLAELIFGEF